MLNRLFIFLAALTITLSSGCEFLREDDFEIVGPPIPELASSFIEENFPNFRINSSETEDLCDNSIVLEVELEDGPGPDVDLYFTPDGQFLFSSRDISLQDIPEDILASIEAAYPGYTISSDDAELYTFPDGTLQYKVELINAQGDEDDLIVAEDGTVVCFEEDEDDDPNDDDDDDSHDDDENENAVEIPETIRMWIATEYPGYRIESAELEDLCDDQNYYEVELEDGPGRDVDLYFDQDWVFQFSATEIPEANLPEAVLSAIAAEFPGYRLSPDEEIERLDYPDGTVQYLVEIQRGDEDDIDVVFGEDGTLVCTEDDNDDDNSTLPSAVREWIDVEYPSYRISSVEREDICDDQIFYEVELEDGTGPDLELYFDLDWELAFTATEIASSGLPAAVVTAINDQFPGFRVDTDDEVQEFAYPDGAIAYYFEITNGDDDVEVLFSAAGNLECYDD
ncbi:PepSY-like domain-containing protein [Lewinella sp. W8]|uniref:PepSY-like domain-containing protein n=1 Tax=Lewinella sp. W8 TaxID=2528208 RepID=UPI00106833BD|nr:PepSY-like domain-containing protein [Lewinella sp. W8]MTB50452.1 hypothetical protein [Lewinella sp. W8]